MFTDNVVNKINELEKEGIPMDQFATVLVPNLVFNKLQRDYISKWGKGVVTHDIEYVRGIKISKIPMNHISYERVFQSENEIIVYSWRPFSLAPLKKRIELSDF